jgi:glycosyltransferase involved in cell wall biosynthesis
MMTDRGHTVYHYGHADSEVAATEHVPITNNLLLETTYGHTNWKKEAFRHNTGDLCNKTFNERAIAEVGKRKQPHDFLLLFWGIGHVAVAKAHPDLIDVHPGIGCYSRPCKFNVFESYAVMNYVYGQEKMQPQWYDAVVPNYFDLADFTFHSKPGDYLVYLGRVIESKGVKIAVDVARATGMRLKVAGQGDFKAAVGMDPPDFVEIVGYVEPDQRNTFLGGALALLAPTHYNEPFGGVTVEAMLCGTPIITSDWGAFAENNIHGVTGYRCRTMEQFVWAVKHAHQLSRRTCREFAERNFSLERVSLMYEEYFRSVLAVATGKGFYEPNETRRELDWLKRYYPCPK